MGTGINSMVGPTVSADGFGLAASPKKHGAWCRFKNLFGHKHNHATSNNKPVGRTGSSTSIDSAGSRASTQSAPADLGYNNKGAPALPKTASIARSGSEGNVAFYNASGLMELARASLNYAKAATEDADRGTYFDNAIQYAKLSAALGNKNAAKFLHTTYQNGIKSVVGTSMVREDPSANAFWNKVSSTTIPTNFKNKAFGSQPFQSKGEAVAVFMEMSGAIHGDEQLDSNYIYGLLGEMTQMQKRIPTALWQAYQVSTSRKTI